MFSYTITLSTPPLALSVEMRQHHEVWLIRRNTAGRRQGEVQL